jgi:hypothetical protein
VVAALALTAGVAQAQLVGTFNGVGSLSASGESGIGQPVLLTFTDGIEAKSALTGIFSDINVGDEGTIQNILVGTGAFNVPNFINISGYTFSLTNVIPGAFPAATCIAPEAPGETCSPPNTPFNFINLPNGEGGISSSATFGVNGFVMHGDDTFSYRGTFTAQFPDQSYQDLIASIDEGGTVPVSYSLTINANALATVPEPATVALMATGLLALGGVIRVRRSQV